MSKPKKGGRHPSIAWKYFTKVDQNMAKCNICSRSLSSRGGSTPNLIRHIRLKHHIGRAKKPVAAYEYEFIDGGSLLVANVEETTTVEPTLTVESLETVNAVSTIVPDNTIVESNTLNYLPTDAQLFTVPNFETFEDNSLSVSKVNSINVALTIALIKNYLPFNLVESEHFKTLVKALCPNYRIPDKKTLTSTFMPRMYELKKKEVIDKIKPTVSVCLSVDSWTSVKQENYISITCHFVDEDNNFQSYFLDCFAFDTSQDSNCSKFIKEEILRIAVEWDVSKKIEAVVVPEEGNLGEPFTTIAQAIQETEFVQIPCFLRKLNTIVETALGEIETIHTKAKSIVHLFNSCPNAASMLKSMQKSMLEPEITLEVESSDWWKSTFNMYKRLLDVKDPLDSVLILNYPDSVHLSKNDFSILSHVCEILELFNDLLDDICSDKQVTSKVIPIVEGLKRFCIQYLKKSELPEQVTCLVKLLLKLVKDKFLDIENHKVFSEATFLDPRFKEHGFSNKSSFQSTKENIIKYITDLSDSESTIDNQCKVSGNKVPPPSPCSKLWGEFDNKVSTLTRTFNPKTSSLLELHKYLDEPLLIRTCDPLKWWRDRKSIYPHLYNLAMKKLSVVGTSISTQDRFSKERRSVLSSKHLSQIMFLSENWNKFDQ